MLYSHIQGLTRHALTVLWHCPRIGGPGAPGTEDPGDFSDGEGDLAANSAAQAAARAAFTEDKAADTFYSSDEDESEDKSSVTGSFVSASAGSMSEPSKKFKVVIKVS